MNSWRRRIVLGLALLMASLLVAGLVLYWKVKRVPAFYQQVEVLDPQQRAASHAGLLEKVEQLKKDVRFSPTYKVSLTEEQLNSWLAENHDSSSDPFYRPRLTIYPDGIRIACRARYKSWQTVISAQLTVEMTDRQNVARVHVSSIQAGSLSIGWDRVMDLLRQTVERTGLETSWSSGDGEAAVDITVPSRWDPSSRHLVLESIQLTEGKITLRGRAD